MCRSTDMVVARYREDVAWLEPIARDCVVYNKGPAMTCAFRALIELPNVGREAHTYVHHIVHNYDDLADVTVFVQGCVTDHVDGDPVEFVATLADCGVKVCLVTTQIESGCSCCPETCM